MLFLVKPDIPKMQETGTYSEQVILFLRCEPYQVYGALHVTEYTFQILGLIPNALPSVRQIAELIWIMQLKSVRVLLINKSNISDHMSPLLFLWL